MSKTESKENEDSSNLENEVVTNEKPGPKTLEKKKQCDICNPKNLVQGFISLTKRRQNNGRTLLFLLVIGYVFQMFFLNGMGSSQFFFLRKELNWSSLQFTRDQKI